MNMALLVIDMQKAFYKNKDKMLMDKASEYINYAVALFRNNNKKVIWIQNEGRYDGVTNGTEGFEIINALKPNPDELRIIKNYTNSFNKTALYENLLKDNIDTVIVTGYCAEHCVLSAYRGAQDKDLTPILLKNAIAGGNRKYIKFVEDICDTIPINILEKIIKEKQ